MNANDNADSLIRQLDLSPHPEGGWYRETWRGPAIGQSGGASGGASERASGTAILFLLKAGERSHWHTVDAEEIWIWQGGDPLTLRIATSDDGPVREIDLGDNPANGEALQGIVPTSAWQAAAAMDAATGMHGYSLVSCIVVPGFDFAGFRLADPGWEPGSEPG